MTTELSPQLLSPPSLHGQVLLCTDLWKDTATLAAAYGDREGVTEAFIKNGMRHALRTLGCRDAGEAANWEYQVHARQ